MPIKIPQHLDGIDAPSIGVPTHDNWIPFTEDEVDSLNAIRNSEYDPQEKERRLMAAAELASIAIQPVRRLAELAMRPILKGGSRFLNYFAGTRYLPVTRTTRINGGPMVRSPARAAEIAALAKRKPGEEVMGVKQAVKKVMKPVHHLREYTTPITTSQGEGVLRQVRPTNDYWKFPDDAYSVKFDTGIDRVRPDFASMPKAGRKVTGPLSDEIVIEPRQ